MPHQLTEQLEEKIFSVGEYLELINELLGPLKVSVEGEISDLKILQQWVFFSLKDAETGEVLKCGLHSGVYRKLGVSVEEGMAVKILGYGKVSPKTGNFGFWVSKIEPMGEGALRRAYELLVKKLESEGFFTRKRTLPNFISHIGVISSRNGVVVQDLMKNLDPLGIRVDFVHSGVEGADSAGEIEQAIRYFSTVKDTPEVLVLIRGGGSLESLQGFNNEAVARAIFSAPMPVLVGIGHDVDAPIATLVADWSASTPTAVAHVINDSWSPIRERVPILIRMITQTFTRRLQEIEHTADMIFAGMRQHVSRLFVYFENYKNMLKQAKEQIRGRIKNQKNETERHIHDMCSLFRQGLHGAGKLVLSHERFLIASDPERILSRGFGLVYREDGRLVRSLEDIQEGDSVKTRLKDGTFDSKVTKKEYAPQAG